LLNDAIILKHLEVLLGNT